MWFVRRFWKINKFDVDLTFKNSTFDVAANLSDVDAWRMRNTLWYKIDVPITGRLTRISIHLPPPMHYEYTINPVVSLGLLQTSISALWLRDFFVATDSVATSNE